MVDSRVLVADSETNILGLTRSLLNGFGIRKVKLLSDAYAVMDMIEAGTLDVLIVDAELTPLNGLEITKFVRTNPASANRYLPVILTTARPSMSLIVKARNAGVTEMLAKPMTMKAVEQRLRAAVERPRPFVRSADYFGPDRRRAQDPRYKGPERRADPDDLVEI
jgi:two-component system chemotaxis response regulator CheY